MSDAYHDTAGNPITLYRLVRGEPDWAASRIRHMATQNDELRAALQEFVDFEISTYDRSQRRAKAYCAIRRRAVKLLAPRKET